MSVQGAEKNVCADLRLWFEFLLVSGYVEFGKNAGNIKSFQSVRVCVCVYCES